MQCDISRNYISYQSLTEKQIREGLTQNKLTLYYQPKIDLNTMSAISFEALARWQDSESVVLGPHLFIPVAEQSELINQITNQVFFQASQQVARLAKLGIDCTVAVNFSMKTLERIDLPDTLMHICHQAQISPESIIIEITESAIMNQKKIALDVISRLHLKGFKLSIDDFGTGYSSIEQLNKLPFSEIKLDRSFIQSATHNASSKSILESSIEMGKKLNMNIVSEGVETPQELALIKELGSDIGQGYWFSKPMPEHEIESWLSTWNTSQPSLSKSN
jgi:EAL domain-containing protein (putative c-di-GMP-specific phosphodiesterase class I)